VSLIVSGDALPAADRPARVAAAAPLTIVLHVGFPKTGSSALQYGFAKNRGLLAERGIHYAAPRRSPLDRETGISGGNGRALSRYLAKELGGGEAENLAFETAFDSLFASPDHPIALVSAESLAFSDGEMLARFAEKVARDRPLVVVALVRDIYGHARSAWMQGIKGSRSTKTFAKFCEKYDNQQVLRLRVFHDALGCKPIRLVHYDSVRSDLLRAFLEAIEVPTSDLDTSLPPVNRSLSAAEAEVLRACNRLHKQAELGRLLSDKLIAKYPDRPSISGIDRKAAARLAERFSDDVAWLNDTFFGGEQRVKIVAETSSGAPAPARISPRSVWRDVAQFLIEEIKALETAEGSERAWRAARKKAKAERKATPDGAPAPQLPPDVQARREKRAARLARRAERINAGASPIAWIRYRVRRLIRAPVRRKK
jgi:hypothetical protein